MRRSHLILALLGLAWLESCCGNGLRRETHELSWSPLVVEDGELVLRAVEAQPRKGARIESLLVELRDAEGQVIETMEGRPAPEDSGLMLGQMRGPADEVRSIVIVLREQGSPNESRVELRR